MSLEEWKSTIHKKIISPSSLKTWASSIRSRGKTIATLNGSFDLLHAGHLYILYEASCVADCLIVALNSDASIKAYKSSERPFIPLESRLELIASLSFVDYVTWFDETDPCALLRTIRPDIHVNGAEYGEKCIESETVKEIGGKLFLVPRIAGLATSEIVAKIKGSSS